MTNFNWKSRLEEAKRRSEEIKPLPSTTWSIYKRSTLGESHIVGLGFESKQAAEDFIRQVYKTSYQEMRDKVVFWEATASDDDNASNPYWNPAKVLLS